ncbi:unnamed protein product [Symbiodinium natans]|uniref:EF-hand domain-containing protein n=1 Tax=Symbiodinium natans TaxID=878477 RepID=A0A812S6W2_9DINO|nr:unnamed protein product [Symbiodinium natans]
MCYLDIEAVRTSLLKLTSDSKALTLLSNACALLEQELEMIQFYARVPSKSNVQDQVLLAEMAKLVNSLVGVACTRYTSVPRDAFILFFFHSHFMSNAVKDVIGRPADLKARRSLTQSSLRSKLTAKVVCHGRLLFRTWISPFNFRPLPSSADYQKISQERIFFSKVSGPQFAAEASRNRLDLPFDKALEELTTRLVHENAQEQVVAAGVKSSKPRRPVSSAQSRPRASPSHSPSTLKRARSVGSVGSRPSSPASPSSKRGLTTAGMPGRPRNFLGQWPQTPPQLASRLLSRHCIGHQGPPSAGTTQPREAWGSAEPELETDGLQELVPDMDGGAGPEKQSADRAGGEGQGPELQLFGSVLRDVSRRSSGSAAPTKRGRSKPRRPDMLLSMGSSRRGSSNSNFSEVGDERRTFSKSNSKDSSLAVPSPYPIQEVAEVAPRSRAKEFTDQRLAQMLQLPLEVVKQAAHCFRQHAACEPPRRPDLWRLKQSDFEKVLCDLCHVANISELSHLFVSKAFRLADMTKSGDLDLQEFVTWYATFSFSEELLLGKSTKSVRSVARSLGINLLDIERYKRVFDSYDKDKSGVIEMAEFRLMVNRLLKVPAGHHLPSSVVKSFWNMADSDGNGEIDFTEFCEFYLKVFMKDEGGFQLSDLYRDIRKVPVNRRRVSG